MIFSSPEEKIRDLNHLFWAVTPWSRKSQGDDQVRALVISAGGDGVDAGQPRCLSTFFASGQPWMFKVRVGISCILRVNLSVVCFIGISMTMFRFEVGFSSCLLFSPTKEISLKSFRSKRCFWIFCALARSTGGVAFCCYLGGFLMTWYMRAVLIKFLVYPWIRRDTGLVISEAQVVGFVFDDSLI
ncbi:hypothetical protein U1Q18_014521 [Sarracenia purpurea var. burkii]